MIEITALSEDSYVSCRGTADGASAHCHKRANMARAMEGMKRQGGEATQDKDSARWATTQARRMRCRGACRKTKADHESERVTTSCQRCRGAYNARMESKLGKCCRCKLSSMSSQNCVRSVSDCTAPMR